MPVVHFGKYKGEELKDVPLSYVFYAFFNFELYGKAIEEFSEALLEEIFRRRVELKDIADTKRRALEATKVPPEITKAIESGITPTLEVPGQVKPTMEVPGQVKPKMF